VSAWLAAFLAVAAASASALLTIILSLALDLRSRWPGAALAFLIVFVAMLDLLNGGAYA
jgi:hypothetical protein